ncbi:alpha/beta hydrolase [Burkholderia gladioli]|uniref:esterase/lipase family protein n=1 Tax=Burkholderia gladioli TaxID=28095 RepID=UPI0030B9572D
MMSENETISGKGIEFTGETAEDDVVRFTSRTAADGASVAMVTLTPEDDKRTKEILCDPRPIMPVIFLPGVMGSLLVDKDSGDEVFFAPNMDTIGSAIAGLLNVIVGWFRSAAAREMRFDPLSATVTPQGPIDVGSGTILDENEARRRGWGSVHRWSYHSILLWLEEHLNNPMFLGELQGPWAEGDPSGKNWARHPILGTDPRLYGSCTEGPGAISADSAEFRRFASFRYRVYAIGYNWLQSNDDSGRDVVDGLDCDDVQTKEITRLMGIREICAENHTGKAIVLTHSMGGLVARFAVLHHGAEDLLHGVFHSVQPATGAPVAAKRLRTGGGSEGGMDGFVNGSLLGRDAPEFVAVVANAPGPLELLPMPDYDDGKPWWIFARINGEVKLKFPNKGNALKELYLNSKWYGLFPSDDQLDPAGTVKRRLDAKSKGTTVKTEYVETISRVVKNQKNLSNRYYKNTYSSYGGGDLKASFPFGDLGNRDEYTDLTVDQGKSIEKFRTWGKVVWTADALPSDVTVEELLEAKLLHDSHKGDIRLMLERGRQTISFSIQKTKKLSGPNRDNGIVPGDGTVPICSADAQARGLREGAKGEKAQGMRMAFLQGGYEHQFSYNHPWTRWSLLYSLVQIAGDVPSPKTCRE